MISADQVINLKVKVTNLLDQSIVGTIHSFSLKQRVLALKTGQSSQNCKPSSNSSEESYRIVNTAFIKSVSVLPPFPKKGIRSSESPSAVPKVDIKSLESALNRMIHEANKIQNKNQAPPALPQPISASIGKSQTGSKPNSVGSKVFDRLTAKLGKENVEWQGNESILLFKEVTVSKPYALNKISLSKKTQNSKHIDKARAALREAWLVDDSSRRGG